MVRKMFMIPRKLVEMLRMKIMKPLLLQPRAMIMMIVKKTRIAVLNLGTENEHNSGNIDGDGAGDDYIIGLTMKLHGD